MYLFLDNTEEGKIIFHYTLNTKLVQLVYNSKDAKKHRDILSSAADLMKKIKKKPADIAGIGVRLGARSFTAVRQAVTVANALAYALQIPVIGYTGDDYEKNLEALRRAPRGVYVSASYSGEARIGEKNLKIK